MKSVQIKQYGDAGVLSLVADAAKPAAASGQVLVEVHAASINPVDSVIRSGYMQQMFPLQFPATLGLDLAGIVVEAGPGAGPLKAGDRVYGQAGAITGGSGAFAEYAAAPVSRLALMPAKAGFVEAAALPLAGVSALQAIYEHMKLQAGQKILIHGGSGGIGTIAIQIAKRLGAQVAATCRGEAVSYVKSLGADKVIDFQKQAFQELLKDYDAVFDNAGGETYKNSFAVLKKGGVIVSMLEQTNTDLAAKYGVTAIAQFTDVNTDRLDRLAGLVADGTIKVHVDRIFPLVKVREAFAAREGGNVRGKVVLKIR
jgi:alcohol dehydrogenase